MAEVDGGFVVVEHRYGKTTDEKRMVEYLTAFYTTHKGPYEVSHTVHIDKPVSFTQQELAMLTDALDVLREHQSGSDYQNNYFLTEKLNALKK